MVDFFYVLEGNGSRVDVDEGGDEGNEEGVGDCVELLEEGGVEVKDKVVVGLLLYYLEGGVEDSVVEVVVVVEDGVLEVDYLGGLVVVDGCNVSFVFVVGNDFGKFIVDVFGIKRLIF